MVKAPQKQTASLPTSIRFEPEMRAELDALAEAEDRPIANMIKVLLKEALAARRKKRR